MSTDSAGRTWCWSDDAADTVVPEQPAIACYTNPEGAVVLRQHGAWNDDDDAWIWFAPEHALAIAKAILAAAGLDGEALDPEPCAAKPKDATAAERQRRRRTRQKQEKTAALFDCDVTDGVTPEDRDTVTRDGEAA